MSEAELNGNTEISDDAIARRAYEIWESRGCPDGDGSDNWEVAREQLLAESQPASIAEDTRRGPLGRFWARLTNQAA